MTIHFSLRKTLTGLVLIVICFAMSYWQWTRYHEKLAYSAELNERLRMPVEPFESVLLNSNPQWETMIHRRFQVTGEYDFSQEVILRNRKHDDEPGFFVITPLRVAVEGSSEAPAVLVNRGFIPHKTSTPASRAAFHKPAKVSFVGLVKRSMSGWRLFGLPLGPHDPAPEQGGPRLDAWLRVEIPLIQRQLPYRVLPIYLEIVDTLNPDTQSYKFFETKSGRDDMLSLATREVKISGDSSVDTRTYPIPVFDTIVPAGRHYGYIWQWLFIALLIGLATLVSQRKPERKADS